jgi:hypothetical protein
MCTVLLPPGVNPIADKKYISLYPYLDGTCVADGTHQTPTYSPLRCKHLLHYYGNAACTAAQNRPLSSVFTQEMTACFTSTSVTNLLPGTSLLREAHRWKSAGLILPTGLQIDCGIRAGRWQTAFPTSKNFAPKISHFFKSP